MPPANRSEYIIGIEVSWKVWSFRSIHHCGHLIPHGVCSLGLGIGKRALLATGIISAPKAVPVEFVGRESIVTVEYLKYTS